MPAAPSFYLGKQAVQAHVDQALTEIVQPDETLLAAFHGQALSGEGYGVNAKTKGGFSLHDYLLVTDQRVIFWARGIFKRSTVGFHYDDIASVEEAIGLIAGEIVLNVRGTKERLRAMVKADVPIAARLIRDLVLKSKSGAMVSPPPQVPQAIYLLRDNGDQGGPFDADEVRRQISGGEATMETFAWHDGMTEWLPVAQIAGVASLPLMHPEVPRSTTALGVAAEPSLPPMAASLMTPNSVHAVPPQPREPWYKRKGWQIAFLIFFPYAQVPLMWYWRLYTRRTRIRVSVAGFVWFLIVLAMPSPTEARRKEFAENRAVLLAQIKASDQAHDYQRVLALGDRYSILHDAELDNYLYTAHASQKSSEGSATNQSSGQQSRDNGSSSAHPLVTRIRALNVSNAEDAGVSDGMAAATNVAINRAQMGDSNFEVQRKLARAKTEVPSAYDLVASTNHLDSNVYANYRRGWVRGFQLATPQ